MTSAADAIRHSVAKLDAALEVHPPSTRHTYHVSEQDDDNVIVMYSCASLYQTVMTGSHQIVPYNTSQQLHGATQQVQKWR